MEVDAAPKSTTRAEDLPEAKLGGGMLVLEFGIDWGEGRVWGNLR